MLLKKGDCRLVAGIQLRYHGPALLVVYGLANLKLEIASFVMAIDKEMKHLRLYRGKKLRFCGRFTFLNPSHKGWDDLSLDPELKQEIMSNTVNFLKRGRVLSEYGIPRKRGIILAGAPGTGKTLISKVLINNSPGITCLASDPSLQTNPEYITELYQIARDLKPSIVFLEDIDLVGEQRLESHYQRGDALTGLLDVLDGVEEYQDVVTVATTNCIEVLDKALSQRPSRFDRVIKISLPNSKLRSEIVLNLSKKIPVDNDVRDHIVARTEGYTPAQIKEIMYSLVIRQNDPRLIKQGHCRFTTGDVDDVLHRINQKGNGALGFK